jgi:hypothetical protein
VNTEHEDEGEGFADWSVWDLVRNLDEGRGLAVLIRAGESDAKAGTTFFVASTDDEDRALDVVNQKWDLKNFRANPVILDNHDHRRVVGRGVEPRVERDGKDAGKLVMSVKWDLANPDPSIVSVGHQHLNGFRSAGSVGFRSKATTLRNKLPATHPKYSEGIEVEYPWGEKGRIVGRYYDKNELLEHSSATIPMNASALQRHFRDRLAEVDPADAVGRAAVVAETVPKAVGSDLVSLVRGLPADELAIVAGLLWPGIVGRMSTDPEARKAIRVAIESTPRRPAAPVDLASMSLVDLFTSAE